VYKTRQDKTNGCELETQPLIGSHCFFGEADEHLTECTVYPVLQAWGGQLVDRRIIMVLGCFFRELLNIPSFFPFVPVFHPFPDDVGVASRARLS
jgi:hypothetical protein